MRLRLAGSSSHKSSSNRSHKKAVIFNSVTAMRASSRCRPNILSSRSQHLPLPTRGARAMQRSSRWLAQRSGHFPAPSLTSRDFPTHGSRAVELIREWRGDAIPLSAMAAAVHLSPDRFRHLFVKETGVGFRAYLLWQRLECSLTAYVAGETLTEAAH